MVRVRVKPAVLAIVLVVLGAAAIAVGAALIYRPAGVIVGGLAAVLCGLFLVDDGEAVREPDTARSVPIHRR